MENSKFVNIGSIAKMFPILGAQIETINENERLIARSRERLIHAGVYCESGFQECVRQAKKESTETPRSFPECLSSIISNYIKDREQIGGLK